MLKRVVLLAAIVALVLLALPALSADQPKPAAQAAQVQAPALSAQDTVKLNRLKALPAPDPKLLVAAGVRPVFKPTTVKKEISCGVWLYPPNANPAATSPRIFWVNTTGQTLPAGVHIEWQVEGYPSSCCQGVSGPTTFAWLPNPPTPNFVYSATPVLTPPQPWTRECKAWVIIP